MAARISLLHSDFMNDFMSTHRGIESVCRCLVNYTAAVSGSVRHRPYHTQLYGPICMSENDARHTTAMHHSSIPWARSRIAAGLQHVHTFCPPPAPCSFDLHIVCPGFVKIVCFPTIITALCCSALSVRDTTVDDIDKRSVIAKWNSEHALCFGGISVRDTTVDDIDKRSVIEKWNSEHTDVAPIVRRRVEPLSALPAYAHAMI